MSDVLGWLYWLKRRLEAGDNPRLLIKEHSAALEMARALTRSAAPASEREHTAIEKTVDLLCYLAIMKLSSRSRTKVLGKVNKAIDWLSLAGFDIPF